MPDLQTPWLDALLSLPPARHDALSANERQWLEAMDELIEADRGRTDLLPRAAGIIPPLLNSLRDETHSTRVLAEQIERDPNLVAEVIRMANSVAYLRHEKVDVLADAIGRIGTEGLRHAIAKVVLKPVFDPQGDGHSRRASALLWRHSQSHSELARPLAALAGVDPFEAYLAGLFHNIGWMAALRALDRSLPPANAVRTPPWGMEFRAQIHPRRRLLFTRIMSAWRPSVALQRLASDNLDPTLVHPVQNAPLAVLQAGDSLATLHALNAMHRVPAGHLDCLEDWPPSIRQTFLALD